jgi:hypothetical protein
VAAQAALAESDLAGVLKNGGHATRFSADVGALFHRRAEKDAMLASNRAHFGPSGQHVLTNGESGVANL